MSNGYVEQREGVYFLTNTCVSLDSIVYAFLNGETAESIVKSFPVLKLEHVYGAITFYLANRSMIDEYLGKAREEFAAIREKTRTQDRLFYKKLADEKLRIGVK